MEGADLFNLSDWAVGRGVRVYVSKSSAPNGRTRRTPVPFTGDWSFINQRIENETGRQGQAAAWALAEAAGLEPEQAYGMWNLYVCTVLLFGMFPLKYVCISNRLNQYIQYL